MTSAKAEVIIRVTSLKAKSHIVATRSLMGELLEEPPHIVTHEADHDHRRQVSHLDRRLDPRAGDSLSRYILYPESAHYP